MNAEVRKMEKKKTKSSLKGMILRSRQEMSMEDLGPNGY